MEDRRYLFVPYVENDGIRSFRDSDLVEFYHALNERGLIQKTFFDGCVQSVDDFIQLFKYRQNMMWVVLRDNRFGGIFWLNSFEQKTAQIHQSLLIDVLGRDIVRVGKDFLKMVFSMKGQDGEYIFDGLIGLTPASYGGAVKYLLRSGMRIKTELPNALRMYHEGNRAEDAVLSYGTREEVLHG
jgi:hypothetical protein